MIALDMQTVMFANVIINFVGMVVMFILWFQNHNKYSGIAYWVLDWILLAGGTLLITLQGTIPPWESMILSNSMIVGGTIILYFGLCRFAGKKNNPILIATVLALFAVFIAIHTYFVYVDNELLARSYNAAAGLLLACSLCSRLMLQGVSPQIRRISKGTGISFAIIAVVCVVRIIGFSLTPQTGNQFLQSGRFDDLMVMLLVGAIAFLVVNLVLMVNRRLYIEAEEMENTIKRSIMELQAILKTTSVGFGILIDRIFKEVNDACCEMMGYSREEMIGKESRMFYPTDKEYRTIGQMYQKIAQSGSVSTEIRLLRKNGEITDVIMNINALDKNDLSKGVVFSMLDITERKKLEEKAVYLASFPELNPNPILELDQEGNLKYLNPATNRFFPDIATTGVRHPFLADWVSIVKELQEAKRSETIIREIKVGNEYFEQVISPLSKNQIRIYARNITERKRAEKQLKESEENLRIYLENAPDGVYLCDLNGVFLYGNIKAEEIIGYKKEELIGNNFFKLNLLPAKYLPKISELLKLNATGKPTGPDELELIRKDKTQVWVEISTATIKQKGNDVVIGFVRDITERKQAEEKVRQSEAKYSTLVEKSNDGIVIIENGIIQFINTKLEAMTGFTSLEAMGRKFIDFSPPEERQTLMERHMKRMSGEMVTGMFETKLVARDGRHIPVEINATNTIYQEHPVVLAFIRDITDRKQAEEALKESEEKYRALFENATEGIVVVQDGLARIVNDTMIRITGYSRAELTSRPFVEFVHSGDQDTVKTRYRQRQRGELSRFKESFRILSKAGEIKWLQISGSLIAWEGGNATLYILTDITEHKHDEEALKASEQNFRNSIDTSIIGIHIVDKDWNSLYANRAFLDIYGYANIEELKASRQEARYTPESYADWVVRHEKMLRGEPVPNEIEADIVRKDGSIRHVQSFRKEVIWNGKQQYQLLYNDITERKQAEVALQESETRYHELVDTITSGVIIYKAVDNGEDFVFVDVNHAAEKMEGINRKDVIGKKVTEVLPGSRDYSWFPIFQRVWQTGNSEYFSSTWRKDESDPGRWRDNCAYKLPGGEIVNVYDDVTDKKLAEEAVKASEQNFRNSMDSSSVGIRIMGDADYTLYANQAVLDIFGYKDIDEVRASPPHEHYTPESYAGFIRRKEQFARGEPLPDKLEFDIIRKDGVIRHIQLSSKEVLWNGKPQYQILYNDITERVRAEEALQAAEQNFRNSIDTSPMAIRIREPNGQTLYANKTFMELFYYKTIEEVPPNPLLDHYTPAEKVRYLLRQEKRSRGETVPDDFQVDITAKDGTVRHLQVYRNEVIWNGKQGFQIIYNDITETKNAQEALQASEQNFRNSLDNSPVGVRISDRNDDTLYANQAFLNVFGYDNLEELKASPPLKHYTPAAYADFLRRMESQRDGAPRPDSVDIDIVRKDGNIRHLRLFTRELVWYGQPQFQNLYTDITERKEAEDALKASEQKYSTLIEKSSDGILVLNVHEIEFSNSRMREMTGYSQNEIMGMNFYDLVAPEHLERLKENYQGELADGEKTDNFEMEILAKDKKKIPVETSAQIIVYKDRSATMVTVRDITKRKQAEAALVISEQNFRNSLDSSLMGIRIIDEAWHTLYANQVFLDIFGYKKIDEVSRNALQEHYTPQEYADYLLRQGKRRRGEVVPENTKVDIFRKDGGVRHLEIYSNEVIWGGKKRREIIYNDITERKQAEEALKASEEKYSTLIEQSADGIVILNVHEIEFANRKMSEMFGFTQAEIIGKHFHDLVAPEYEKTLIESDNRKRIPGVPNTLELGMLCKDGRRIFADTRSLPIVYEGRPARMVIIRDITERKRAEEELKASEQNFRSSIDSSSLGIRISDIHNNTLYANQTLLDIFGYKNIDEVIAKSPQDHYSSESYAEYLAMKEKYGLGEVIPEQVDIDIVRKDGAVRHLQASFKIVLWNGKKQFQTLYDDVTERKKMEEALRESEEKYRLIVENTRDIIFTVNDREEYVYVSPSVKSILGYNPIELIGKPFLSFVHPEDRHIINEETQLSFTAGYKTSANNEYRLRHASGEWRWVVSNGTRVIDPSGKFLYFTGVIRDITANKQAEKEKQILEEKAQVTSRLAAVGEMAAGIAHEINNPLTGVLGFSQMLLENKNVPEDIKENIALIADGSQRVADIVKRLLTFARQAKPIKAVANLNELVENTLKLREYVLKTNSIDVVGRLDPELPWSVVDPGQLQQVFLNLIVNAEQAMRKAHGKGTLTITTEKKENNLVVSFKDDGPGITRENMAHLFEPFFTTKAPGEGTGLGLSLSRSIILEHNGKMNVESEYGHGATFIVELPIVEALPSEVETTIPVIQEEKPLTNKGRILVVDDESGVRALLDSILRKVGYSVDTIGDSRAAKDIIDAGTIYDVILMDIRMPGMSGIELYTLSVRKIPSLKNKIIFITGDLMGLDIKTFLSQNNLPYLSKPFDIELLKEKIDVIMKAGQI